MEESIKHHLGSDMHKNALQIEYRPKSRWYKTSPKQVLAKREAVEAGIQRLAGLI